MMAMRRTEVAPALFTVVTAAAVEFPVASIGSRRDDIALGDVGRELHVVLDRLSVSSFR
jgi:hypothetical protein